MEDMEYSGFVFDQHQVKFKTLDWKIAKGILKIVPLEFKEETLCISERHPVEKMSNAHQEANNVPDLVVLRL